MEELQNKLKQTRSQFKKTTGMVNKFAALSGKGKCSDQDWQNAIDSWLDATEECFEVLILIRELELGVVNV